MLSLSEARLITLQETTTVSGATSGSAIRSSCPLRVQPSRIKAPHTSDLRITRTRSRLPVKVHRVRPAGSEAYSPKDGPRARLPDVRRMLPNRNRRPHPDRCAGPGPVARDGSRGHRERRATGAFRDGRVRDARRWIVRTLGNEGQSSCVPDLRSSSNHVPGVREGKPAMSGIS